jgi:hypothetical protein
MKDLMKEIKTIQYLAAQATITATTTSGGKNISDAKDNVLISLSLGALAAIDASNYFTLTVTQATTLAGTYSAAAAGQYNFADDFVGGLVNDDVAAGEVLNLNFKPKPGYPFIKVVLTKTGTVSAFMSGEIRFENRYSPV